MADLGTLISIAKNVYKLSQAQVIQDIRGCKADLEKLNNTVSFIKNMLLDADAKPELSHAEQAWVDALTEVLYEADDLFDEVITIAEIEKLNGGGAKSYKKVLNKVSRFFSSKNRILLSYSTSQEVKSIQQKLDAIAKDHARFEFKVDSQASLKRKVDTCSFLDETHENIIGREDDVKDVIGMVLDPMVKENVGFVVIVGIEGVGKTTLAQLVFNHDEVKSKFEKKLWVCVSDQDGKKLDVQAILGHIIESSINKKPDDISTMQSMQTKFQEELKNKSYLLILDDVWTEDPNEWSKLRRYLTIGSKGSRVVITTRSEKTAEVVLGKTVQSKMYMLDGLSDEHSWHLFVLTAFERESNEVNDPELTKIGKNIVEKCCNVPLAIKVVGTLLYGQTDGWKSFEENRLPQIETTKNSIMSILKLSYNNLEPSVKSCFRYCALFPKDFVMNKRELISLWMAQGYIGDSEDNFLVLLKRCFFQDLERNGLGDVVSFTMHDLIHDLAQQIAGDDFIVGNNLPNNLSKKNRHIYLDGGGWKESSLQERNIRTCYMNTWVNSSDTVKTLIANWHCLRSLRLYLRHTENLPESIGELLHLRYLDLSGNGDLTTLPNSIVKLYNLQSLILYECYSFKEWPKHFYKLVNLSRLDIGRCLKLTSMPLGIGQMTKLRDLTDFKLEGVSSTGKQIGGELKEVKFLVNLSGELHIIFHSDLTSETVNVWDGGYLEFTKNLKVVEMYFYPYGSETNAKTLIAKLQPYRNLIQLRLSGYNCIEIPRWGRAEDDWAIILPNLVKIQLDNCERLHGIPLLSHLKHLKSLSLQNLNNLEYMETNAISENSLGSKDIPFFPSLEYLSIERLGRLKGWWGGVGEGDRRSGMQHWQPSFPRLSMVNIRHCPKLTSFPPCPILESLQVMDNNKSFRILPGEGPSSIDHELWVKQIDNVGYLATLPARRLTHISIIFDYKMEINSEIDEVLKNSSSLRSLELFRCRSLTSVSGVLKHLTALESLNLNNISSLVDDPDDDMPWRSLRQNLHTLKLGGPDSQQILPTGMRHLTALQNLSIWGFDWLKGLLEWISCLSSLHTLTIDSCSNIKSLDAIQNMSSLKKLKVVGCEELREACKEPSGKEWPNIQHIPHISLQEYRY